MKELLNGISKKSVYFNTDEYSLILGDSLRILKKIPENSIDMIFADPPYFLSNNGITCSGGKMVSVNKAEWDKGVSTKEKHKFNHRWLKECQRVLKKDGTIWISGTYHNIYSIGLALEELEYRILNNITWFKKNAAPNLSCRFFTHSTETILWASKSKKAKHTFHYQLMKERNGGKQKRDVWEIEADEEEKNPWNILCETSLTPKSEKIFGKHPTQKPYRLLEEIILASTNPGDIVLDPFNGSGTTGVAAMSHNRKYIGIDLEVEYIEITTKRLENIQPNFELLGIK